MADLKPLGSEKLTGQNKIKRIMEIARYNEKTPNNINETSRSEYSITLADMNKYEIVKERQGYIIKKTISESETEYIEPIKNRKYYSSYSQAFKRLNLVAGELNRINENEEGVSLYGEQKRFTLKTPKPISAPAPEAEVPSAPPPVPAPSLPPSPNGDMAPEGDVSPEEEMGPEDDIAPEGDVDMTPEDDMEPKDDMSHEEGEDGQVSFKTIQKLTGKLTQKIRVLDTQEGMTSEDIKYVINMVLSSLDLTNLSEEDKEDILSKFEEDKTKDLSSDDMGGKDMTDDSEVEDIQSDMDVPSESEMEESGHGAIFDHIFKESKVDKVISKYFEVSKSELRENKERKVKQTLKTKSDIKKKMESVIKLTETIEQELASKKFLEENINFKLIGKTNKDNLVFENNGKQIKISPEGFVL